MLRVEARGRAIRSPVDNVYEALPGERSGEACGQGPHEIRNGDGLDRVLDDCREHADYPQHQANRVGVAEAAAQKSAGPADLGEVR